MQFPTRFPFDAILALFTKKEQNSGRRKTDIKPIKRKQLPSLIIDISKLEEQPLLFNSFSKSYNFLLRTSSYTYNNWERGAQNVTMHAQISMKYHFSSFFNNVKCNAENIFRQ